MKIQRIVVSVSVIIVGVAGWILACGPLTIDLDTVKVIEPADRSAYARGTIGVVRPRFARRYLVQGYRVLSSRLPLATTDSNVPAIAAPSSPDEDGARDWRALRDRILGAPPGGLYYESQGRVLPGTYQAFLNCTDGAFATAVRTLRARIEKFGASSTEVTDWTRAQIAVFANCAGPTLTLPAAAPATADPLVRADRGYQTAAAYFYAMQYEEAAIRFRAIAADSTSPWRSYGHFLAARATIRSATMRDYARDRADQLMAAAEAELQDVLADPSAAALHQSARGLLNFIAVRIHAVDRLHAMSSILATAPATDDVVDSYTWLMDRFVGDTVDYSYAEVKRRDEMIRNDDLTDWVLAMQGRGEPAVDRAVARWQATRTVPWLVAVLWRLPGAHAVADAALDAAQAVGRASPAFSTVAYLRVRLLARLGRRDEARRVLATLPSKPEPGFDAETINLLGGERLMLADTLDEFLASAPRTVVLAGEHAGKTVFDEDAALAFNDRFPLDRLIDASESTILPRRLRLRVAMAAFTRAIILRRDDGGARAAAALRGLAPVIGGGIDRYLKAATAQDRHTAGVFLLLRTPGMHASVLNKDDDMSYAVVDPSRKFDHLFRRNWWCDFGSRTKPGEAGKGDSEVVNLLYDDRHVPYPAFVTADERAATDRELRALAAVGFARDYLATEALAWAKARPTDPNLAEALAQVVEGWRWGCGEGVYPSRVDLPHDAFTALHRLFPQSDAARRTKYWYK